MSECSGGNTGCEHLVGDEHVSGVRMQALELRRPHQDAREFEQSRAGAPSGQQAGQPVPIGISAQGRPMKAHEIGTNLPSFPHRVEQIHDPVSGPKDR